MSEQSKVTKVSVPNFGAIKEAYNSLLSESVMIKDHKNKALFKQYFNALKENEILKTQFLVYKNIEDKIEPNQSLAVQFVKENISLFDKFSKKEIEEANLKLAETILFEQGSGDYQKKELHENISKLILTTKTATNIDQILEALNKVADYIVTNKAKEINEAIELPTSMLSTLMVDKYNEKYSTLDESEKQILKVLIDATDEEKKEVYSNTLRECIDLINIKLEGADLDVKDKLLRVKDKLLNDKKEINEDFAKNISKLAELRESLKK